MNTDSARTTLVILLFLTLGGCETMPGAQPSQTAQVSYPSDQEYVVQAGDSLSKISQRLTGTVKNTDRIAKYNNLKKSTPLRVGQRILIPADLVASSPVFVQAGSSQAQTTAKAPSANPASDPSRTRTEGALIGAGLGGLIGMLAGNDNRLQGALIGAAVGAAGGFAAGHLVAQRKQQYATTEAFLDAEIANAAESNRIASEYNRKLTRDVAALDKEMRTLHASYDAKSRQQGQPEQKKVIAAKLSESDKMKENLAKQLEYQQAVYDDQLKERNANDPRLRALEKQNTQLRQQLAELDKSSRVLAQMDERISR